MLSAQTLCDVGEHALVLCCGTHHQNLLLSEASAVQQVICQNVVRDCGAFVERFEACEPASPASNVGRHRFSMLPRERPSSAATCLKEFTSLVGLELAHVVYHGLNERVDGVGHGELDADADGDGGDLSYAE